LEIDITDRELRQLIYLTKQRIKLENKRKRRKTNIDGQNIQEIKIKHLEQLIEKLESALLAI